LFGTVVPVSTLSNACVRVLLPHTALVSLVCTRTAMSVQPIDHHSAHCLSRTLPPTSPFPLRSISWQTESRSTLADLSTPNYPEGIHAYSECSDRGLCDTETGRCVCFAGYEGHDCGRSSCPEGCSGHGQCVLDAEVDPTNYYHEGLLQYQKQYWNAYKTQQCVCDRGWWGTDCSLRLCPEGEAQTGCDSDDYVNDVHMVTLTFTDLANTPAADIEQFFTLTYTDMLHGKFTTKPISYWDDVAVVQDALNSLPNFALRDVEVNKMSPLYVIGTDDPPVCTTAYHEYFQDTSCAVDADCTTKFPASAGTNPTFAVFCDKQLLQCVETAPADACLFNDGRTEFDAGCGTTFQVDGMYLDSADRQIWGRQTTAAEKTCQVGTFGADESIYSKPCNDESACTTCSSTSAVGVGMCSAITNTCAPSSQWDDFIAAVSTHNCNVASFLVSFISTSTPGQQQLLECNVGSTDFSGASPRYASNLLGCSVTRVSRVAWTNAGTEQRLCFTPGDDAYEASFVDFDDATSLADCEASFDIEEVQTKSHDESYKWVATEDSGVVFRQVDAGIYTSTAISDSLAFQTATPCSSQGDCDAGTGICSCASGYHGLACEHPDVDVFV
jgi:hypothetical protein